MRTVTKKAVTSVVCVAFITIFSFSVWFFTGVTDSESTYEIGLSAFYWIAKRMYLSESDFVSPLHLDTSSKERMVTLEWMYKLHPQCGIEVDIDRRYANARPRWRCSGPEGEKENALDSARMELGNVSEKMMFDMSKFGFPVITGSKGDGYTFIWKYESSKNKNLDVIVLVSRSSSSVDGYPFFLDCRAGRDSETREAGFGFLCKQ
jgi:hypothetical protein